MSYLLIPVMPGTVPISQSASAQQTTFFSDTFNRSSGKIGDNWFVANGMIRTPTTDPISVVEFRIGPSVFDGAQCLIANYFGSGSVPNTFYGGMIFPAPIYMTCRDNPSVGDQQFSQATFLRVASGAAGGPAVCARPDQETSYVAQAIGASVSLLRWNNGTFTVLGTIKAGAPVGNEVYKLAASRAGGGNVTLSCYINGGLTLTVVDSSASRLLTGSPALSARAMSATASETEWRNYSGGVGT